MSLQKKIVIDNQRKHIEKIEKAIECAQGDSLKELKKLKEIELSNLDILQKIENFEQLQKYMLEL